MKVHYAWVIALLGFLTVLGAHGFGRFAYSLVLTDMMRELGLNEAQMGLIATFNFIGYLALATVGGALASRYGSRAVISLSALVMGVAMILTGLSRGFGEVLLWRFVTGMGNGGAYLPAMALPSVWFAFRMRGRATGLVSAGIGAGFALAGVLVPVVLSAYQDLGWRYAWFYMGSALLAIFLIDLALLRNRPEDLGLAPLGEGGGSSQGSSRAPAASGLAWGLVYKSRRVWMVGLAYFMYGFSYIIYVTFFAHYLRSAFGWTPAEAGGLWFVSGVLSIISGVLWGWVSDALGRKYGMSLAYVVLSISYILFALALPPYGLYASAVLFGIAAWSVPTVAVVAAADYVRPELRAAAAGFVTLFFGIGQAIGPYAGGYLIVSTGGFQASFLTAFLVSLLGALVSLTLKRPVGEGGG